MNVRFRNLGGITPKLDCDVKGRENLMRSPRSRFKSEA